MSESEPRSVADGRILRRFGWGAVGLAAVVLLVTIWLFRWSGHAWLTLEGRPQVRTPRAHVEFAPELPELPPGLDELSAIAQVRSWALETTARQLEFGLGHPVRLRFPTKTRRANCIEYAHLFGSLFNRAAEARKLAARARVVHSPRALVFGWRLPFAGWRDHDWVWIDRKPIRGRRTWEAGDDYVDPTFYDYGLGWSLSAAVAFMDLFLSRSGSDVQPMDHG